jgi:nucleoside-diphosphate-sugar epimerase
MHHLILGYGYCGYYLAQELLKHKEQVTSVSRHLNPQWALPQVHHIIHDLNHPFNWPESESIIYYLIPPSSHGEEDIFLKRLLSQSVLKAKKVLYFGSSAVYGNHQGAWVTEQSACHINNSRQLRRLDAEQQWLAYCGTNNIEPILLRIAGIYGPHRIPMDAAKAQTPIVEREEASYTNHIFVKDLATIATLLSKSSTAQSLYNIADGNPHPMGTLQQLVAKAKGIAQAPYESWPQAWDRASLMKREFMQSSKRLNIESLKKTLDCNLSLTCLEVAIQQSIQEE